MKVPYKWLSEYVDLKNLSAEQVSEKLTLSGSEVDILYHPKDFKNIVVGDVLTVEKHPKADRLRVAKVKVDKNKTIQIVCGAPNLEKGQKVPVALPGARVGEVLISKVNLRDVESQGMICSEAELDISEEHSGIMVLDPGAKVGQTFSDYFGADYVMDLDITPNRSDCFSMIGIAREAAAVLGRKLKNLKVEKPEVKSKKTVNVEVAEKDLCPRYIAKVVEGVKIEPSPKWMQNLLAASGVRPINNIVDVTNYVMMEWGQPMHAFDGAKISDKIVVRKAKEGEKLVTLDGTERKLIKNDLIIADGKKAIALAGVMGGLNSEVTKKTNTVVLEAAVFDRTSVRKTAQRLALRSEASNRFEKGIPLGLPEFAIERAAQLLAEISEKGAGIKVGENTDVLSRWIWTWHVGLSISELNKFLGTKIIAEEAISILTSLGFEAEKFDFKKEARRHVGKPYVWGASYKTHGDMAFDCSYLTDYIYSRIGQFIGHTSLAQFELGQPVEFADLIPGDILFTSGVIDKSVTDHYFVPGRARGFEFIHSNSAKNLEKYQRVDVNPPKAVGHNAIYIGNGRVVHARHYDFDAKTGKWKKLAKGQVIEENLNDFVSNPTYLGARRYVENSEDWIAVTVPWWRLDVSIEEDLFEEIGRIYGYENLPSTLPSGQLPRFEENKLLGMTSKIKEVLAGGGFNEVYNYSFVSKKQLEMVGEDPKSALKIANPLSPDQEYMRTTLVPSLIHDIRVNQDNYETVQVFEIASVYAPEKKTELAAETTMLGLAVKVKSKKSAEAFFAIKGVLELLAKKLNLGKLTVKETEKKFLAKGQAAQILFDGKECGFLGMTSEKVTHEADLKTPVAVAEINLEKLVELYGKTNNYVPVSKYPTVQRDVNLVFDVTLPVQKIEEKLISAVGQNLKNAFVTDIFEGGNLPQGTKSVTIRMIFASDKKTLTEDEVSVSLKNILDTLAKELGAKERV